MPASYSWTIAEAPTVSTGGAAAAASGVVAVRDFKLTALDDLEFEAGDLVFVSGVEAIAQSVKIRLRFFQGEWFADFSAGIPYFQQVLSKIKSVQAVESIFRDALLATPGIANLSECKLSRPSGSRLSTLSFRGVTDTGELIASAITVGV